MKKHYVRFMSPGTFFNEESVLEIHGWDIPAAVELAKTVTERYNAKPYGFQFLTKIVHDPVPDGDGGVLRVESKQTGRSCFYYLGGRVRTYKEVVNDNAVSESILRDNMRFNEMPVVVENCNSWRFTGAFDEDACIVDETVKIIRRGNDPDLAVYRGQFLKASATKRATRS